MAVLAPSSQSDVAKLKCISECRQCSCRHSSSFMVLFLVTFVAEWDKCLDRWQSLRYRSR